MINETKNKHKDICYTLTLISLKSHFQFPYNQKIKIKCQVGRIRKILKNGIKSRK